MTTKLDIFNKTQKKEKLPEIKPGDTIRVFQRIKEGDKERTQAFEGILIAHKHGTEPGATITVRKISFGVGVERIYPLHSPTVEKIELVSRGKSRRAKLYYLRERIGRSHSIKKGEMPEWVVEETPKETASAEKVENEEQTEKNKGESN